MIRRNQHVKMSHSAKIILRSTDGDKTKSVFRRAELEAFEQKLQKIPDIAKRNEGMMVLECLLSGKKVILENKKIFLYTTVVYGEIEANWVVTKNNELYSLLEDLVQS